MYNSKFRIDYRNIHGANTTEYAYAISDLRSICASHGMAVGDTDRDIIVGLESGNSYEMWFPNEYGKIIVTRL